MATPDLAIPKGSLVLVTGVTGFVASHIAREFLERGYKVRGTVRDMTKASWLLDVFKAYGEALQLVVVRDLGVEHAFDNAIRGVHAIVHAASIVSFDPDPNRVIPQAVAGTTSILRAALDEPSVQQFVYTSSLVAEAMLMPGKNTFVGPDTYNDMAVELAWAPPPYEPSRHMFVYMASKVSSEKAVWKFAKEMKPNFTINAVNPAMIFGQPLNEKHVETRSTWLKNIWDGDVDELVKLPAAYIVDVKDVALLHVAAVLDPDVQNARIQAWGRPFTWNGLLAILRKLRPDHEFIPDLVDPQHLELSTDFTQTLALLKRWGEQDDWKPLVETITDNLEMIG